MDATELYVANLREALKQYDTFLRLALIASLTYMVLSYGGSSVTQAVSANPLVPIPLTERGLALLAFCAQFVFALLAANAYDMATMAGRRLLHSSQLLEAACGYPSFATSPTTWVRITAILVAPTFLLMSLIDEVRRGPTMSVFPAAWGFLILVLPYGLLIGQNRLSLGARLRAQEPLSSKQVAQTTTD